MKSTKACSENMLIDACTLPAPFLGDFEQLLLGYIMTTQGKFILSNQLFNRFN